MITVPSHDPLTRPGHIHNLGQGSYAHHARCSFQSAERGTCRVIYGGVLSVSVSGDLRDSRGITGATEQPVQIVAPNFWSRLGSWSSTPLVQFLQEPASGLANRFQSFRGALAHVEQRIREGFKDVGKWFGVLGNV